MTNKIKINILHNPKFKKPGNEEYRKIQKIICNDENIKELDFKHFAYLVGEKGYIWKSSLLEGGAKNENFKEAYILSLDFDEGIRIEEFLSISKDLGLEPTFIYETFSHKTVKYNKNEAEKRRQERKKVYRLIKANCTYKVNNHRFRAIWRLNEVITMPQLKNALQLMLMEIFPGCDSACKDLSRLWIGGKKVSFYNGFNTLNLDNLLNALVNSISERDPHNLNRNIKAFCKRIGINIYNKYPFILKSEENCEKSYNIINRELRKNTQKIDTFIYDNMEFSFDTKSYNNKKGSCSGAKIQTVKSDKIKRIKIDFEKLKNRCNLYKGFVDGTDWLYHNEIFGMSTNLYNAEKYPSELKQALQNPKYDNYVNKYNTLAISSNFNYAPTRCENYCKYFNECGNPKNILEKYYQKESKVKKLYDEPTITLAEAEKQLEEVPSILKEMNVEDLLILKAVTGIGKTELLKRLSLENVIIGVPNHKLGTETYERLKEVNPGLLYVKPLNIDNMPVDLKNEIQRYYDLGIPGEVKNLAFDEIKRLNDLFRSGIDYPQYYYDLLEYVDQLEKIPNADTMLFTHHRISYGNQNTKIDTIILDEDFLKSFIKYNTMSKESIISELRTLVSWGKTLEYEKDKYNKTMDLMDYIKLFNAIDCFEELISTNNGVWFENPLREFVLDSKYRMFLVNFIKTNKNSLNMDIFKLFRAEYIAVKQNQFIHMVNGEAIKELEGYKIAVMSATIDEDIHYKFIEKYLPTKNIIFKNIANTELKGKIYCDCSYSWSRDSLKNISSKSSEKINKILSSEEYTNVITFMNDELIDVGQYGKKKIAHFGATEGIDQYKNQNLCIIGTPHNNSALYEAYGVLLTGKSPISNTWKVKRVQKYGFEFDLNTYENEADKIYTDIQLYFLYSELIQAVGRARALRFNCNVYVHSALPLPNCILI